MSNYEQKPIENWRLKRIQIINSKKLENFRKRKINPEFANAIIQNRILQKLSTQQLAYQLMITEEELIAYENQTKCPDSYIVVKLRKIFTNLPRKYFIYY